METKKVSLTSVLIGFSFSVVVLLSALGGAVADRVFVIKPLEHLFPRNQPLLQSDSSEKQPEKSVVEVAQEARDSVVTIAIQKKGRVLNPFLSSPEALPQSKVDIGSGFSVSEKDGLIVTNKHVVSDPSAQYTVIDADGTEYAVEKLYRDPEYDLAILFTSARLPALSLANSDEAQTGQAVIAIGTALGEFRQTVTTGVISGLGRGIEAGDGFFTERIENLIQTDAAINPGNSGGPLLNMNGEALGVNVAVAQAENIGFAIPINTIQKSLDNFNKTGQFERPFLGVQYKILPKETALLNDVPEGAYVVRVNENSTAAQAGVLMGDIITVINDHLIKDEKGGVAAIINRMKIGDTVRMQVWRAGQIQELTGTLQATTHLSSTSNPPTDTLQ